MWKSVAAAMLAVCLGACANYRAVGQFGARTDELTGAVRKEVAQVDALCVEQAELYVVLSRGDERPLQGCAAHKAAEGRLAALTLDVLDGYAEALKAIADDRRFDLDQDLETLSGKVQGLKNKDGQALLDSGEVVALSKVVEVLFEVAATRKRDAAVKRLVAETPELERTGAILRRFFAGTETAGGPVKSPYTNLIAVTAARASANEQVLQGPAFTQAEPIRTYELLRAMRDSRHKLAARQASAAEGVRAKMVASIDAWQAALHAFAKDALKPDPKELLDRLKDLSKKARAARKAVEG